MADSINQSDKNHKETEQKIFDEGNGDQKIKLFDIFGEACENEGIKLAVAIILKEGEPQVFYKGHMMDVAVLVAAILREMKSRIAEQLDTG